MEDTRREDGVTLSEVFKILWKNIKLLLIVFLIGAVLGSSLGFLTSFKVKEYGTRIEFYVNPKRDKNATATSESQYGIYGAYGSHVMDNMIKLLSSESFAEQLMTDEKGLPPVGISEKLDGLRKTAEDALAEVEAEEEKIEIATENVLACNEKISKKNEELSALSKELSLLSAEESKALSIYLSYVEAGADTTVAEAAWETAKAARVAKQVEVTAKEAELKIEKDNLKEANDAVETAEEAVEEKIEIASDAVQASLEEWRVVDENYKERLLKIKNSVSFSYFDEKADSGTSFARSFIYVDIKVDGDEDFAKDLCARIKTKIPSYVEANMTVPSGYNSTNCKKITRIDEAVLLNENFTLTRTLVFGVLLSVLSAVGASIVLVVADRSKQRRKEQEETETLA